MIFVECKNYLFYYHILIFKGEKIYKKFKKILDLENHYKLKTIFEMLIHRNL